MAMIRTLERKASALGLSGYGGRAERIVDGVHVDTAERVHDQNGLAGMGLEQIGPGAGGVHQARIVERADQARLAHDIGQGLALVPAVVAERQDIGAGGEDLARRVLGDAEAARGVLGVDHHEVEFEVAPQPRKMIRKPIAPGLADHVTEKCQSHGTAL